MRVYASSSHCPLLAMPGNTLCNVCNKNFLKHSNVRAHARKLHPGGFFCKGWSEEWVVLYEDSTLAWFADKSLSRPRGFVRISEAPELLAVGEWTRQVPRKPRFPRVCHIGQLMAVGSHSIHDVHWLMGQSPAEMNDWMTAISNTLPPPPQLPLDEKRLTLTNQKGLANGHANPVANGCATIIPNGRCSPAPPILDKTCSLKSCSCTLIYQKEKTYRQQNTTRKGKFDNDHTVLAGVCVDWGHGVGWTHTAPAIAAAPITFTADAALSSAVYCHTEDYSMTGFDDVDWSVFGDFCF